MDNVNLKICIISLDVVASLCTHEMLLFFVGPTLLKSFHALLDVIFYGVFRAVKRCIPFVDGCSVS